MDMVSRKVVSAYEPAGNGPLGIAAVEEEAGEGGALLNARLSAVSCGMHSSLYVLED